MSCTGHREREPLACLVPADSTVLGKSWNLLGSGCRHKATEDYSLTLVHPRFFVSVTMM